MCQFGILSLVRSQLPFQPEKKTIEDHEKWGKNVYCVLRSSTRSREKIFKIIQIMEQRLKR